MKTSFIAATIFLAAGLLDGFADPSLSADAALWCDWSGPNVGSSTNFYANNGTFAVAQGGNGSFGSGAGEVTFTSNNPEPVVEHQFGNSIWAPGKTAALFDPTALAGKTGIEMLVNVDPASTSEKICIKLLTTVPDEAYAQTVTVEKGSPQLVQFPLSGFKSSKNPDASLEDFSTLNGTIQVTDGWNGYPKPAQAEWKCKFSNISTYGAGEAVQSGKPSPKKSPSR